MISALKPYDVNKNVHRITLYNTVAADQQHTSKRPRLYLHVDMNCFYAQVEQQSYNLYGFPLIVGGWRKEDGTPRGIVATSSYEARELGIKTAMSALEAQQICPSVVFLQVHYEKYQAISRQINKIFKRFSPDVEAYSMDEYFLDISFMLKYSREELRKFAMDLKNALYREASLIAALGVSYSKTYSKLSSDLKKPDGLTIVGTEEEAKKLIYPLDLDEVWGIGRRRYEKLRSRGLHTIADAVEQGSGMFKQLFGQYFGQMLFETATGRDKAKVLEHADHIPEEVTYMHTFSDWTANPDQVRGEIAKAVRHLCYRMRGYRRKARKFGGYIRFQDQTWKGISFVFSTGGYTNIDEYVLENCLKVAIPLLRRFLDEGHRIRGVGLHTIELTATNQLELFFREDEKLGRLYYATDLINNRYGLETIQHAAQKYDVPGHTHFLDRSGKAGKPNTRTKRSV